MTYVTFQTNKLLNDLKFDRSPVKVPTATPLVRKKGHSIKHQQTKTQSESPDSTSPNQTPSPVMMRLKEDLKLAKSAIRTCPLCSKGNYNLDTYSSTFQCVINTL